MIKKIVINSIKDRSFNTRIPGIVISGFILLTSTFICTGAGGATPVLVLNNPTSPPFTTPAHDGLLDIVVGEAFQRAGLRLKLVSLPAERGLINANDGIDDGDLSRIAGMEKIYPNLVRVPEPIFTMDFVAFSRTRHIEHMTWSKLRNNSVSYIKGWKIFEHNLSKDTEITTTDSPEQMMNVLALGRVQFALYSRWMGLALAQKMKLDGVEVLEPPLAKQNMYVYLNKKQASHIHAIARALRQIKQSGMYRRVCIEKFSAIAKPTSQCWMH